MSTRRPPHRHQSPGAPEGAVTAAGCAGLVLLLSASLDGELPPEEASTLEAHLAVCPRCAARKAALLAQAHALRAASERALDRLPLADFSAGVLRAIARDRARPGVLGTARQALSVRVSELWSGRRVQLLASVGVVACAALLLALPGGPRIAGPGAPPLAQAPGLEARASVESLDISGASYAVLDLEGSPTTVIWVSEEGN